MGKAGHLASGLSQPVLVHAHYATPQWGTREGPLALPGMAEGADAEPMALAEKQQNQAQQQEVPAEEQEALEGQLAPGDEGEQQDVNAVGAEADQQGEGEPALEGSHALEGEERAEAPVAAPDQEGESAAEEPPGQGDEAVGESGQQEGAAEQEGEARLEGEEGEPVEGGEQAEAVAAEGAAAEEAVEAPPAAPPHYVPPEVGEDYVPVALLPPLPLPYGTNEEGKIIPLPGVESIFLTGTTVELIGLGHLASGAEPRLLTATIGKEDLLKDIQFRGAISDFYAYKAKIQDADYTPLVVRTNEDDLFGDGNNYQLACSKEAVDVWNFITEEAERRKQLLRDEVIRTAIEKAKPRSKKVHKVKPWISMGSEVEIEEASVRGRRDPVRMMVARTRREFNQPFKHSDKDAHELWNSSQMECRPYKDPNFDLRKMEQSFGVQAVQQQVDLAVQVGSQWPRPNATQYVAQDMGPSLQLEAVKACAASHFLDRVIGHCEVALIQNEISNVFSDDFVHLTDEDGMSGSHKESIVTEAQSFTHLTYSKNKVVSAVQWLPHRRGVVAVACSEALSHAERVVRAGRPTTAYILVWNFKDPIHPECVLQAPSEVFAFQYNPCNTDMVAGGCYNGQVLIWDTSFEQERISRLRSQDSSPLGGSGEGGGEGSDEAHIPVIKCRYTAAVEFSHHTVVTDLQWLPGLEINGKGKVSRAADGAQECNFFATTAGDGKVYFWDMRMDRFQKKGRKVEDALDMVWKPTHSIQAISLIGMDLGGTKMCFGAPSLEGGLFFVGSADGELVRADFVRPEGPEGDNPDYVKSITQAHVGPIVAIQRSPFYEDIILTVGDWSFQVWREGNNTSPLFVSGFAAEYYTCGCWSPSRPAVLFLADQGGNLEIWDLLDRSHEPSIRVTLTSTPFMSLAFMSVPTAAAAGAAGIGASTAHQQVAAAQQAAAQFLALGDSAGVLRIMELPRNLRRPVSNERKLMSVFLEREAERVSDVASRKPTRDAANKEWAEASKKATDEADSTSKDAANKDQTSAPSSKAAAIAAAQKAAAAALEIDEKSEAEYEKTYKRFQQQLGLIEDEDTGR